jgi:hypothetical protein
MKETSKALAARWAGIHPGKISLYRADRITLMACCRRNFPAHPRQGVTNIRRGRWSQVVATPSASAPWLTVITYASLHHIGELCQADLPCARPGIGGGAGGALHDDACNDLIARRLAARSVRQGIVVAIGPARRGQSRKSARMKSAPCVEAENAGVLEPGEKEMIAGVMRLGDLPVGAVMTPRREVSMINLTDDLQAVRSALAASSHSRFVVFDQAADAAVGIVNAKDMLDCYLSEQTPDVGKLVRPAPIIPEFLDARDVVAILRDSPSIWGWSMTNMARSRAWSPVQTFWNRSSAVFTPRRDRRKRRPSNAMTVRI